MDEVSFPSLVAFFPTISSLFYLDQRLYTQDFSYQMSGSLKLWGFLSSDVAAILQANRLCGKIQSGQNSDNECLESLHS